MRIFLFRLILARVILLIMLFAAALYIFHRLSQQSNEVIST